MEEQWKDIEGYENLYQVSDFGRVKRLVSVRCKKEHILCQHIGSTGYFCVALSKNGKVKTYKVHQLVANAFVPNKTPLSQVSHLDESRLNNHASNLAWASAKENSRMPIHRIRCSTSHKGKIFPEKTRRKMRDSYNPLKSYWYGRKSEDFSKSRKVIQLTMDGEYVAEFGSLKQAQDQTGAKYTHISSCCSGKRKSAGGYKWTYKSDL